MSTISQFYEVLSANIPVYIENALERAGSDLLADLKARAFPSTAGEGKDADGNALKRGEAYTSAYKKIRSTPRGEVEQIEIKSGKRKGELRPSQKTINRYPKSARQVNYVDLQFNGDLMSNGIGINKTREGYVIDFTNDRYALIVEGIEKLFWKQTIFAASTDEAEKAFDTFEFLFFGQVEKLSKEFGFR